MEKNFICKTADCAFMHLLECRMYFVKMSALNKFAKKHKITQFGIISTKLYDHCRKQFSEYEKQLILEDKHTVEIITKLDNCINEYLLN